jgi:AcrR family transcriptional regulator
MPATPSAKDPGRGPEPQTKQKRRRNPEASKAAILDAARHVFTERGYAGGSIREIAKRAGVTHGLVIRHFGSKEKLLIAALPGARELSTALPGPLETLPERSATTFVAETEGSDGDSTLIALIRSAASGDEAVRALYTELDRQTSESYRAVLGEGADVYIDLLRSLFIGVAFTRHVAKTGAIAELDDSDLLGYLTSAIRALLAPVLDRGHQSEAGEIAPDRT